MKTATMTIKMKPMMMTATGNWKKAIELNHDKESSKQILELCANSVCANGVCAKF